MKQTNIESAISPPPQHIDNNLRLARLRQCGRVDLFKHALPAQFGGVNTDFPQLVEHHKQLGYSTHDTGLILAVNAHVWGTVFPLIKHANDLQVQEWLPGLISGKLIGGHAITEAHSGSDPSAMRSKAIANQHGYLLNADKCYITNATIADLLVVYVMLDDQPTGFVVSKHDSGFHTEPTVLKSCRGASMGKVLLDNCQLDKSRLLGKPGMGLQLIQQALELERAYIFAGISGIMEWQLEQIIDYSRRRQSGTVHLGKHQAISHKIADMKLRLDTIQLWVNQCATLSNNQQRITLPAAQTKLYASEAFLQSSLDAVHIMGAHGLDPDTGITELVADAMAGKLFSGSSEIQKNIIAALSGTGDGFKGRI
ncbi:MAG TPA: acyl-CoA dehydrogenase [Crenotrichaceae bacterium]|nr:acyl-CoA dehydrogenase [Crenotrichaceae bacterium]